MAGIITGLHASEHVVTVFVHGTVASSLHLLGLHDMQKSFKEHYLFKNDQLATCQNGLSMVNLDDVYAHNGDKHDAASLLIAAYDQNYKQAYGNLRKQSYALFGWSGKLDNEQRKKAGFILYQTLIDLQEQYIAQHGALPSFELVGHSHGGNVCLWLAEAEKEYKKGLIVERLSLLATPLQKEIIENFSSSCFKKIDSFYSWGDKIQGADIFSTKSRKSYQRIQDLQNAYQFSCGAHIKDIQLMVESNAKKVDHVNLWYLGRGTQLQPYLSLLPVVTYLPFIYSHIDRRQDSHIVLDFSINKSNGFTIKHGPMYSLASLQQWYCELKKKWRRFDQQRHPLFNKKTVQIIKDFFAKKS